MQTFEASYAPLQLQKLFVNLALSQHCAVSTFDLTHSFGWTAKDTFHQHDVQVCIYMYRWMCWRPAS